MSTKKINPISLFNSVLRLQHKESCNMPAHEIYQVVTKGLILGSKNFAEAKKLSNSKPYIEYTFGSSHIVNELHKLVEEFSSDVRICIGTICNKEQAKLVRELGKTAEILAFSPYYDKDISDYFTGSKVHYAPAVTSIDEFDSMAHDNPSFFQDKEPFIKVFPCIVENRDHILKALEGPFPELKDNRDRISLDLESDPDAIEICSPQDYIIIKEDFIKDKSMKLKIGLAENSSTALVKHIKSNLPNTKLACTGISTLAQLDKIEELLVAGASQFGSSLAIKGSVEKLNNNELSSHQAIEQIAQDIYQIYDIMHNVAKHSKTAAKS